MAWRNPLAALLVALGLTLAMPPAAAVQPDEVLADPVLEARARKLSAELRCLVCQNQSIDDSNAPLARDLRLIVRERLKSGDSDAAAKAFIVARYGEFVLLRPPLGWHTIALWLTPVLLLCGLALYLRRQLARPVVPAEPLSADEEARLALVMAEAPAAPEIRRPGGA